MVRRKTWIGLVVSCLFSSVGSAEVCPKPTNFALVMDGPSAINGNLTWSDNCVNEANYLVEMKSEYLTKPGSGTYTVIGTLASNTTSYRFSNMLPGRTYFYRVKARNSAGDSEYSSEAKMALNAGIIESANLRSLGGNAYEYTGSIPKGADTMAYPTQSVLNIYESRLTPTFTVTRLARPHEGFVKIQTEGLGRYMHKQEESVKLIFSASDNTNPKENGRSYYYVLPQIPPPSSPTGSIETGASGSYSINLKWEDNSGTGFVIERTDQNRNNTNFVVSSGSSTFSDTGAVPGAFYSYRIRPFSLISTTLSSPSISFNQFVDHGAFIGRGELSTTLVGPGRENGSSKFYLSYFYYGRTGGEILAVDPQYPIDCDQGVNCKRYSLPSGDTVQHTALGMALGRDGKVYLGTKGSNDTSKPGSALMARIDPKNETLEFLEKPPGVYNETQIYGMTLGSDGKIYGCTYPNSQLVTFDPTTQKMLEPRRIDADNSYGHRCRAGNDGYIYVITQAKIPHIIAMPEDKEKPAKILFTASSPAAMDLSSDLFLCQDNRVYANVKGTEGNKWYRLSSTAITPIAYDVPITSSEDSVKKHGPCNTDKNYLADNKTNFSIPKDNPDLIETKFVSSSLRKVSFSYAGKDLKIFSLTKGPASADPNKDNRIYASSYKPMDFMRFDVLSGNVGRVDNSVNPIGTGEIYSYLPFGEKLFLGSYSGNSNIMSYDPDLPYNPGWGVGSNPSYYPVPKEIQSLTWRPKVMVSAANKIFIASTGPYGVRQGYLTEFSPPPVSPEAPPATPLPNPYDPNPFFTSYAPVKDHSVESITPWDSNGKSYIVGGTNVCGGNDSCDPNLIDNAVLFVWDIDDRSVLQTLNPIANGSFISQLVTTKSNEVVGIATNKYRQHTLFVYDPIANLIKKSIPISFFDTVLTNKKLVQGRDGLIYGICPTGIFTFDPNPNSYQLSLRNYYVPPTQTLGGITAGFSLQRSSFSPQDPLSQSIFFGVDSHLVEVPLF